MFFPYSQHKKGECIISVLVPIACMHTRAYWNEIGNQQKSTPLHAFNKIESRTNWNETRNYAFALFVPAVEINIFPSIYNLV